jgi:Protein of unknown function (DUF2934)
MELKEKRNEHLESLTGPAQSRPENISATHELNLEEIRLRAYEIHLQRGGFPGNELDDWLQAERELQHAAGTNETS